MGLTEDDTFAALSRVAFEEMLQIRSDWLDSNEIIVNYDYFKSGKLYTDNGWTRQSFSEELRRRDL